MPKSIGSNRSASNKSVSNKIESKTAVPKKAARKNIARKSTVPESVTPESTVPENTAPKKTAPKKTAPNKTAPNKTLPTVPKNTAPNGTTSSKSKSTSKGKSFRIADNVVAPGTEAHVEIPVSRLVTGTWLSLPVTVVNGMNSGPVLCLSSAIHGDELNGVEIIRRVLQRIRLEKLSGTLVAVPIVNVYGFISRSRYMPDRRDLNRSFPGTAKGSLAARLAHLFLTQVIMKCDYGIDLHTGSNHRTNLPHIRADLENAETLKLARVFGASLIIGSKPSAGTLRSVATKRGVPMLLYEAGETNRFNEYAIDAGVKGVLSVMKELGMYSGRGAKKQAKVLKSVDTRWLRASQSGIFYQKVELGAHVTEGQTVGVITDTFGDTTRTLKSPLDGLVIGHVTNPLVHQGEAVLHIARLTE